MSFPVFEAASRRTVENWAREPAPAAGGGSSANSSGGASAQPGQLPPDLSNYSPDQVKLICLSQVSAVRLMVVSIVGLFWNTQQQLKK